MVAIIIFLMHKKLNYNPELEGGEKRKYSEQYINQELSMWDDNKGKDI